MTHVVPIYKVGLVLARAGAQVLVVRTHPKNAGEVTKFVLPRGSRQYFLDGEWHDARDAATALAHADTLEPLTRTLLREAEEEAGIAPADLQMLMDSGAVRELGVREFASSSKPPYPIHWFVALLPETMTLSYPVDAMETRWASLGAIKALAAAGDFSPGYVAVVEEALGG